MRNLYKELLLNIRPIIEQSYKHTNKDLHKLFTVLFRPLQVCQVETVAAKRSHDQLVCGFIHLRLRAKNPLILARRSAKSPGAARHRLTVPGLHRRGRSLVCFCTQKYKFIYHDLRDIMWFSFLIFPFPVGQFAIHSDFRSLFQVFLTHIA